MGGTGTGRESETGGVEEVEGPEEALGRMASESALSP